VTHCYLLPLLSTFLAGNILSWIISFVTERSQCTKISGIVSFFECINRSIVQGLLCPNSFSLYVADLKALGKTNSLCKYADDTTLLVPQHCDVQLADELQHVIEWSKANKLKLNLGKTFQC